MLMLKLAVVVWMLVISYDHKGATTIPGFVSEDVCRTTGGAMVEREIAEDTREETGELKSGVSWQDVTHHDTPHMQCVAVPQPDPAPAASTPGHR